ncbi:ArsR/SmtB family transcription factor [Microbacterium caowuchunii]|uniref:ArsR/SmtB family transcription factor n=1 Tax=Microbacterium caowuchunii TaxID=2614638 RepID=UPI001783FD83|nr:helix-turn-helix domain-containing protein [Microbacterium caowuchunii]
MDGEPDIAIPARALGDTARGLIATALLGNRQIPAGELARTVGVSPSTASEHLRALREAGLVEVEHRGRNRFYRLANQDVARAIEALQAIAPTSRVRSLRQSTISMDLRVGRTCYDHLAGEIGLRITDLLVVAAVVPALTVGAVAEAPHPFPRGATVERLGLRAPEGRRPWARGCLDWSGRRPHVGGQLGAQVLESLEADEWVVRRRTSRAVRLTPRGESALESLEKQVARHTVRRSPG